MCGHRLTLWNLPNGYSRLVWIDVYIGIPALCQLRIHMFAEICDFGFEYTKDPCASGDRDRS